MDTYVPASGIQNRSTTPLGIERLSTTDLYVTHLGSNRPACQMQVRQRGVEVGRWPERRPSDLAHH